MSGLLCLPVFAVHLARSLVCLFPDVDRAVAGNESPGAAPAQPIRNSIREKHQDTLILQAMMLAFMNLVDNDAFLSRVIFRKPQSEEAQPGGDTWRHRMWNGD